MTTITTGEHQLQVSTLGAENPLPQFQWQRQVKSAPPPVNLSPAETSGRFVWGEDSTLPYLVRDGYDRSQAPGALPAIFIENDHLRLTVYPTLGGRLASIFDKAQQRELLFANPVFQPANLATLNAWFSGGIEWNAYVPGHSPFTCAPIFATTVETERGPILRLYEFDRACEAGWQVDLFLPADRAELWVHVRLTNPNPHPVSSYWWTNVAVPLKPGMRVLSPADYCIEHVQPDNHLASFPFPHHHPFDGSYPAEYPYAASVFFRRPEQARPWLTAVYADGRALLHASTARLLGRKMFVFGNHAGGRRWMDFLSLPGQGDYIEMQGGVTPTQDQRITMAPGQVVEWTECFAPLTLDVAETHQSDYQRACQAVEQVVFAHLPDDRLATTDAWMQTQANQPINSVLHRGRAWGKLFEQMTGEQLTPGLDFEAPITTEALWMELLETGTFSTTTLSIMPPSWAVSDGWVATLKKSADKYGTTWLHELLLGVAMLDRKRDDEARGHFVASCRQRDTYLARRHLALISLRAGDTGAARDEYLRAWALIQDAGQPDAVTPLAVETCQFFQAESMLGELETFLAALPATHPADVLAHERIQLARGEVALAQGRYDQLRAILQGEFCTVREGETLLTDLWFGLQIGQAEQRQGRPLSAAERAEVVAQNPPPFAIDFRMDASVW